MRWRRWTTTTLTKRMCHAILHGKLTAELTDDPRGTRFVVGGATPDSDREIEVVCRFLPSGLLRIITVYPTEE